METLKDKVVLITGASSGIGAGVAIYFARLGSRLSLSGRNQSNLEDVVKQCQDAGLSEHSILTTIGDITKEETRKDLIARTVATFGQLDVLVNNAGVPLLRPISEVEMSEYDNLFNINVKAQVFLTQLAIPHLIKTKGNVVNMSSIGSVMPVKESGIYCMSKAALDMFTKCLALELAPKGVRLNSVHPGIVPTPIMQKDPNARSEDSIKKFFEDCSKANPSLRNGTTEDVAWTTAFLSCEKSSFITGETLMVDGGIRYIGLPFTSENE